MRLSTAKLRPRTLKLVKAALLVIALGGFAAVSVEAFVRARLESSLLSAPTRYYARPLVFERGEEIDRNHAENTLKRLGYSEAADGEVGLGEYRFGYRNLTIGRRAFRIHDRVDQGGLATIRYGYSGRITEIRDQAGSSRSTLALEPELIRSVLGGTNEDRIPVNLASVPQHLVDAVLAIEDQRFFEHDGLDPRRVVGAALANVRARRIVQGASTITQQLAKNLFLSPRRSISRKIREVAIARTLELRYEKEEILEAYLNEVYLGQNGALAIHGIGRAAQFYFGKDIHQLTMAESALLAGIIRGPSIYSPFRHPEAAIARRNLVLSRMQTIGVITEAQNSEARNEPLRLRSLPMRASSGRYFVDFVSEQLETERVSHRRTRGLSVFTTLNMDLQIAAEVAVKEGLEQLERYYPRLASDSTAPLQAAVVVLDPQSGDILAMVGGRNYGRSQFNRAVFARRQPGSSFKPIVALAALSAARTDLSSDTPHYTLASVLDDEPLRVETPTGLWEPANYDGRFRGPVTLREAIEGSLNVPFARLGIAVGPDEIVRTARALGIQHTLNPVPSIALGSSEVSPLELTRAYGVLASGGYKARLHCTIGVLDEESRLINRQVSEGEHVYDAAEVFLITSALRGAVERGTGSSLRSMGYEGAVAAKSGTTNNFRDAWFMGYTPTLAVGVWVGFDDGRSIGLSGSRAALPIFGKFLRTVQDRFSDSEFPIPYGLEVAEVDRETGLLGGPGCRGEPEVFLNGTAPERSCSPHWRNSRNNRYSTSSRWSNRLAPLLRNITKRSRGISDW